MSIEDRVAKLERENTNWRMLFGAVAALMVVWLAFTTVLAFLGATRKQSEKVVVERVVETAVPQPSAPVQTQQSELVEPTTPKFIALDTVVAKQVVAERISVVDSEGHEAFAVKTGTTDVGKPYSRIDLYEPGGESRFYVVSSETDALMALRGGTGMVTLSHEDFEIRPLNPANASIRRRGLRPDASESERAAFADVALDAPTVRVEQKGIAIYNPLGEQVVSIQSNKGNDGAVYLKDATGSRQNSIGPLP